MGIALEAAVAEPLGDFGHAADDGHDAELLAEISGLTVAARKAYPAPAPG
ncbi:hypothetical protein SMC26_39095 [Actinomadura fulvescens]|uniref:Uncharacterized protein n=1 Tax=Actinomadura fulvescens TaxID=46160 RepID=A0ABP6D858_9ACTN